MKRFRLQILNFNEHGQNSYLTGEGGNYIDGSVFVKDKTRGIQGLTALAAFRASLKCVAHQLSPHCFQWRCNRACFHRSRFMHSISRAPAKFPKTGATMALSQLRIGGFLFRIGFGRCACLNRSIQSFQFFRNLLSERSGNDILRASVGENRDSFILSALGY